MRTIRISDAVWQAIAEKGKFGETPNVVLERVFGITQDEAPRNKEREMLRCGTLYMLDDLDRIELGKDTRPERFQLDGRTFQVQTWVEVCKRFVEWLISKGYLTVSKCPIPTGSERMDKYFINTKPIHLIPEKGGDWKAVGIFYVDIKYNALHHIKNIRNALKYLNVHNNGIMISFRDNK